VDIDPCIACFKALLHRFCAILDWSCYFDRLFNAVYAVPPRCIFQPLLKVWLGVC
jgi:hypothetical protein